MILLFISSTLCFYLKSVMWKQYWIRKHILLTFVVVMDCLILHLFKQGLWICLLYFLTSTEMIAKGHTEFLKQQLCSTNNLKILNTTDLRPLFWLIELFYPLNDAHLNVVILPCLSILVWHSVVLLWCVWIWNWFCLCTLRHYIF